MYHRPRKRFGQHFLIDDKVISHIINSLSLKKTDNVLEIGPGQGVLTAPLIMKLSHLVAVEIDRDLQKALLERFSKENFTLIPDDALLVDYGAFGNDLRVIGNLPYNISTPILFRLMTYKNHIRDIHVMLQKEVVDRMAAKPGSKTYGRLSVMVQYHCDVIPLFDVPPEAFNPPPKVASAVVRLKPWTISPFDEVDVDALEQVVAQSFSMRRKTIANNLKGLLKPSDWEALAIDPMLRPEALNVADYVSITRYLGEL